MLPTNPRVTWRALCSNNHSKAIKALDIYDDVVHKKLKAIKTYRENLVDFFKRKLGKLR